MKQLIFFILTAAFISASTATELKLEGIYHGKDIFVQNSIIDNTKGVFCISEVYVNDEKIPSTINSSAFSIPLGKMGYELGDEVAIVFRHNKECAPIIINPEVLKPISTYDLTKYEITENSLTFHTSNEASQLKFHIEEYRWGKWIQIDEVKGLGGPEDHVYQINIYPHNGTNKFRLKQIDHMHRISYSEILSKDFELENIKLLTAKKAKSKIEFSKPTIYELYNAYGERVRFGSGSFIDIEGLKNGTYYLSWDDQVSEISIKQ